MPPSRFHPKNAFFSQILLALAMKNLEYPKK